jgi:hypothetical protein
MIAQEELELFGNLPKSEQLMQFYCLRGLLENCSAAEGARPELKKIFCDLVLGLSPNLLEIRDIYLVQKICPEAWQKCCAVEWGEPVDSQTTEDQ